MIKVEETVQKKGFELRGSMPDILTYLERESERKPKIKVSQYIRLRELEKAEKEQIGIDVRRFTNARR